jgi:hypothetical protein
MYSQAEKPKKYKNRSAINVSTRRRSESGTTFQLQDKRYQNKGNFVNHLAQPIQLVLKYPNDAQKNAELTQQYHDEEERGDAVSSTSTVIDDHRRAMEHYKNAISLRKQAAQLHTEGDLGHKTAIDVLKNKRDDRKDKINKLTPLPPASKVEQEKVPVEVKRKPQWFGQTPMGTGAQASWLTGIPAWYPRK